MSRLVTVARTVCRTLFRMEVTFVLLLLAMTAIGRANDLDARIRYALSDTVRNYLAEQAIAALDKADTPPLRGERTTAALPVGR